MLLTHSCCSLMLLLWTARVVYSVDGDMSYMVYRWRFPCWIIPSRYQSHESIYWGCTTSFVTSIYHIIDALFMLGCVCWRHDFQCMLLIQIYRYTVLIPARNLAFIIPLVGEFWLPWIWLFRSWSLDRGGLPGDQSCATVASWITS